MKKPIYNPPPHKVPKFVPTILDKVKDLFENEKSVE